MCCCDAEPTPVTTDMMLLHLAEGMSMKDGLAYFLEQHGKGSAAAYRACLSAKGRRPVPVIMKVRWVAWLLLETAAGNWPRSSALKFADTWPDVH